jgi:hypothetical protein
MERYRAKSLSDSGEVEYKQKRAPYFTVFRPERTALKVLSNNPPDLNNKNDRTIVRRVYYRTLPFLFSRLSYWRDREILHDVERYYYGFLTTVKLLRSEAPNAVGRLNWELRHFTSAERVSLSKRSSVEPTSGFGF